MSLPTYDYDHYTLGWIATLEEDLTVAQAMLDEEHAILETVDSDENSYTLGQIGLHNVVILSLSQANKSNIGTAIAVTHLMRTFPNVRAAVVVGTAGGAIRDSHGNSIRRGDVVVGVPRLEGGAVTHFHAGPLRNTSDIHYKSPPSKSATILLGVVERIAARTGRADYELSAEHEKLLKTKRYLDPTFRQPDRASDLLYSKDYKHQNEGRSCRNCSLSEIVRRGDREFERPEVHYGGIGSPDILVQDPFIRDMMSNLHGVLCFDTNSAGVGQCLPSLVIRGISDYSDTHGTQGWRQYAASMAGLYARKLILNTPAQRAKRSKQVSVPIGGWRPPQDDLTSTWDGETAITLNNHSSHSLSRTLPQRPEHRRDFRIGIICALTIEADMVEGVFDKCWDDEGQYGKANGDRNEYSTGVIARHNVVLAYLPDMGSNSAAQAASNMRSSFRGIEIVLVVGVCGAVPAYEYQEEIREIVLGDCIVSTAVVQFDFGRRGPNNTFNRKGGLDGLGRAPPEIRALMTRLKTSTNATRITEKLQAHLTYLQEVKPRTIYPGAEQDRLYESDYLHVHRPDAETICKSCDQDLGICRLDCIDLGCEATHIVPRQRLAGQSTVLPNVHFGTIGSSNSVLKSGKDREKLAQADNLVAFEMEGSGVWDVYPTIVIKGACDYADSHKNKAWQSYAAAVAAAGLKALLEQLVLSDI